MKRRILSIFLAIALLCTLLPASRLTASAAEIDPEIPLDATVFSKDAIQRFPEPLADPNDTGCSGKTPTRAPGEGWAYECDALISINELLVDAIRTGKTSIDVSAYGITYDEVNLYALLYYSPYITSKTELICYINSNHVFTRIVISCAMNRSEVSSYFAQVDAKVAQIDAVVAAAPNAQEKALALHEYLVYNSEYDYDNLLSHTIPDDSYKSAGVVMNRIGVCQSYAFAFMYFMHRAGVECHVVTSDSMNHAWNVLKLGDNYYHVDVTWDDPTPDSIGMVRHNFFLLSDRAISDTRSGSAHSGWTPGTTCDDTGYDNAFWHEKGIMSPIILLNGNYYYCAGNRLVRRDSATGNETALTGLGTWPVWHGNGFWIGSFTGLWLDNGKLYHNSAEELRCFDLETLKDKAVFTPDTSSGYIYGSAVRDGMMYYVIKQSPNESGMRYAVHFCELTGKSVYTGDCGENLTWTLNLETGVLEISGTGDMTDWVWGSAPWTSYLSSIKTVRISEGVTHIGSFAFANCTELTSVVISDSVTSIGDCAFDNCSALNDVYYAGTGAAWKAIRIDEGNGCLTLARLHGAPCSHMNYHAAHKDATCAEPGYDGTVCNDCGKVLSETVIPALGHDIIADPALPATCTASGLTAGEHCSRCDYKVAQQTVPILGHNYVNGVCTLCGAKDPILTPQAFFNDVPKSAWYYDAVNYAVENKLMNGVGNGNFAPNDPMTRAMLVTVLWRYAGSPEGYKNGYSDVQDGKGFTRAVAWAAANGIVTGTGNNKFGPDGYVTREQMAAILFRYAGKNGINTSRHGNLSAFSDGATVSKYAKEAMEWVVGEEIITGSGGMLVPQGNATRAQVATTLMRFLEGVAKK